MGDVLIPAETLALFSGMLSAVIAALIALFWLGWRERDARIADLKAINQQLIERQAARFQEILTQLAAVQAEVKRLRVGGS